MKFSAIHTQARCWLLIGLGFLLAACSNNAPLLPKSGGRLFEVVVVNDANALLTNALSAPTPALPQEEPLFDVSTAKQLNQLTGVARNIVELHLDSSIYNKVEIRYERNLHAQPQLVVHVNAPSAKVLQTFLKKNAHQLTNLLLQHEMETEATALKEKHNVEGTEIIRKTFGISLFLPADLTAMKQGKNFLWFSDDGGAANRSICVYRLPKGDFAQLRDSIMRQNIRGEKPETHMQTVKESLTWQESLIKGKPLRLVRGLWEMQGDAMGGPFVACLMEQGDHWLVAEAFVYAPGTNKRNKIRQLEAALQTIAH